MAQPSAWGEMAMILVGAGMGNKSPPNATPPEAAVTLGERLLRLGQGERAIRVIGCLGRADELASREPEDGDSKTSGLGFLLLVGVADRSFC